MENHPAYCPRCGTAKEARVPSGDNRERRVCPSCDYISYLNPRPVAAAIVTSPDGLLLCRRAIEPRVGYWTTPGGFQEVGESTQEAARRETQEEACAEIEFDGVHALLDIPFLGQTYTIYRARLIGEFRPGEESQEVQLFPVDRLPWSELAFPVLSIALRWFVEESASGQRHVHTAAVSWDGSGDRWDPDNYCVSDYLRTPLAP